MGKLQGIKEEIERVNLEVQQAERDYDLNRLAGRGGFADSTSGSILPGGARRRHPSCKPPPPPFPHRLTFGPSQITPPSNPQGRGAQVRHPHGAPEAAQGRRGGPRGARRRRAAAEGGGDGGRHRRGHLPLDGHPHHQAGASGLAGLRGRGKGPAGKPSRAAWSPRLQTDPIHSNPSDSRRARTPPPPPKTHPRPSRSARSCWASATSCTSAWWGRTRR
jgi:hypothetical protein